MLLRDGRIVTDRKVMTAHRMNIGTITADSSMVVKYLSGKRPGMVEETFLSRLGRRHLYVCRQTNLPRQNQGQHCLCAEGEG